jgi:rhodanese-related sulfurtransferase
MHADGAVLLDVRTAREHAGGHIEGSVNIPLGKLERRASELPRDREVIVDCRSGARSDVAAGKLRTLGFEVHDLGPKSAC